MVLERMCGKVLRARCDLSLPQAEDGEHVAEFCGLLSLSSILLNLLKTMT